jgi:hypothetical protein
MVENSWVAERLAASQEGLSSMELVLLYDYYLKLDNKNSHISIVFKYTQTFLAYP